MASFSIKTCGLNNADLSAFKSMLKLAKGNLHHHWEIVNKGDADLYVYCLDYEAGKSAWEKRNKALSCLLKTDSSTTSADVTLQKPLRVKSFSEAINKLDRRLPKAKIQTKQTSNKPDSATKSQSFISSLSAVLPRSFSRNSQKDSSGTTQKNDAEKTINGNSPLKLKVPEQSDKSSEVALNEILLEHWLDELPDDNLNNKTILLLNSLSNFNQTRIHRLDRLHLLDIYRDTVHKLIGDIYSSRKQTKNIKQRINLKLVDVITQLITELANGYKIIISEIHNKGIKPDTDNLMLIAINRTGEQLSISCRHAYKYYKTVPEGNFSDLNEIYLLAEDVKVDDKTPHTIKDSRAKYSIGHIYKQLLLVSIISPYNLFENDVLKVYEIFNKLAPDVKIQPADSQHKIASSHFFINYLNDRPPSPKLKLTDEKTISSKIRMLNTQSVLTAVENIFQAETESSDHNDLSLLKQIVPHLNTSYQRKEPRIKIPEGKHINLLPGFTKLHQHIEQHANDQQDNNPNLVKSWKVFNQSSDGLLVGSDSIDRQPFFVGDIVCLLGEAKVQIASLRWLQTDHNQLTRIGLKLFHDHVKAIQVYSDKHPKPQAAIIFLSKNSTVKTSSIICLKGLFVADQPLYIMATNEVHTVTMDKLVEHTPYYDRFTCSSKNTLTFD